MHLTAFKTLRKLLLFFVLTSMVLTLLHVHPLGLITSDWDFHGLELPLFLVSNAFWGKSEIIDVVSVASFFTIEILFLISTVMMLKRVYTKAVYVISLIFFADVLYIAYEVYLYYFDEVIRYCRIDAYQYVDFIIFPSYISRLIAQLVVELILAIAILVYGIVARKVVGKKEKIQNKLDVEKKQAV